MFNLDGITNENHKKHNEKWSYIPDHPYKVLITDGSGSGKTNVLLNLIKEQDDIDKIYLYAKDLKELILNFELKREDAGIKHLNDSNAFIECSNTMGDIYEHIYDCNPNRKRSILFVFCDMIADIMSNEKIQAVVKELFIRCKKLNISFVFVTQNFFCSKKCQIKFNSLFGHEN